MFSVASAETKPVSENAAPFAIVLGTAQDGGLPQLGGVSAEDEAARKNPAKRRLVASLLVVDPGTHERFLVDATPDLPSQLEAANRVAPRRASSGRPPLFEAIALTHAHVGHYAGLLHLGREAYGADNQRVLASPRMASFLETNGPWSLLVKAGHIRLDRLESEKTVALNDRIRLTPMAVPHRDEFSDTFGFVIRGPKRSILWLPDIDKWDRWSTRIEDVIAGVDVAFIDGTFFDGDEVPGRNMAEIPHPFIAESIARFSTLPAAEMKKIVFVHLNHTNPAARQGSRAETEVRRTGMRVAKEGERQPL